MPYLAPTPGARKLVTFLHASHKTIVVATSGGDDDMNALLEQAGVANLIRLRASKNDVRESKPDADIVHAALAKAGADAATTLMIGVHRTISRRHGEPRCTPWRFAVAGTGATRG